MTPPRRPADGPLGETPDELLVEALFGDERGRRLARARLRAAGRMDELLALEATLARSADELRAPRLDGAREARFVTRVLAATTRRDPSWRGDVRLLFDFLRARLRASPALRLVAASLVLHLVAGPVVAYWVLRAQAPERRLTIHVERPSEEPFTSEPPAPPDLEDELLRQARQREARENERARQRFVLGARASEAPQLGDTPLAAPELELLRLRGAFLRDPRGPHGELGPPPSSEQALALVLWVESALDRFVLLDRAPPALGPACQTLDQLEGLPEGSARLAQRAVSRAASLGWLPLDRANHVLSEPLLDAAWFEALEQAGTESGLSAHEAWRAWTAFGPPRGGGAVR